MELSSSEKLSKSFSIDGCRGLEQTKCRFEIIQFLLLECNLTLSRKEVVIRVLQISVSSF